MKITEMNKILKEFKTHLNYRNENTEITVMNNNHQYNAYECVCIETRINGVTYQARIGTDHCLDPKEREHFNKIVGRNQDGKERKKKD